MAITVETALPSVGLTKNEVKLELSSDNRYSTAGSKAYITINISDGGGAGGPKDTDTFNLTWTDANGVEHSLNYTFVITPISIYQITAFFGLGFFMDDWVQDVFIPRLNLNYYLTRDFDIILVSADASNAQVKIQAKEKGSGFNFSTSEAVDDFTIAETAGTDTVERSNFELWLAVFVEQTFQSGVFDKLGDFANKLDANEKTSFYLEKFLKSYLSIDLPNYATTAIAFASNILKRYFVFYCEAYGNPASAQTWERYPVTGNTYFQTLMGGLAFDSFPGNSFVGDYCTAKSGKKWLTNMPNPIKVLPDQQAFLAFYVTNNNNFQTTLTLYFSDGTNNSQTIAGNSNKNGYIAFVPTGLAHINIPVMPGGYSIDDVIKYELYIKDFGASTNKTQTFTFVVDRTNYENKRQFIFVNSFGCWDSLHLTGTTEKDAEFDFDELTMIADNSNSGTDLTIKGETQRNVHGFTNVYKANSGYKSLEILDWYQEFLNSDRIFEIKDGKYIEITLLTKEIKVNEDDNFEYSLEIQYKHAFQNKAK